MPGDVTTREKGRGNKQKSKVAVMEGGLNIVVPIAPEVEVLVLPDGEGKAVRDGQFVIETSAEPIHESFVLMGIGEEEANREPRVRFVIEEEAIESEEGVSAVESGGSFDEGLAVESCGRI